MTQSELFPSFPIDPVVTPADKILSPFSAVPDENLLAVRDRAYAKGLIPADFRGRIGVLLTEGTDGLTVRLAFEPLSEGEGAVWDDLKDSAVWPRLDEADCQGFEFVNARGEVKTLNAMLAELFAPFPDRDDNHGGREQRERRAKWRGMMVAAAKSPSVRLFAAHTKGELSDCRPVAVAEWWAGKSPVWQIRHDKAFIAPRSGARYLFDWLLDGIPHCEQDVICRETTPELPVLYEDDAMVIVNKPARLASVVGGRETVSAESILNERYGKVHVVHRLDMGTSGVLVFAKKQEVLKALNAAFRARDVVKHYVARLEGELPKDNIPASGEIRLPLMLDWFERPKQCVFPQEEGGREALTKVSWRENVDTKRGVKTLVNLYPVTGRTHQLRLHCAHPAGLGLPIDGDPFYGSAGLLNESVDCRLCLHAAGVAFRHPVTNEFVEVYAEPEFPDF